MKKLTLLFFLPLLFFFVQNHRLLAQTCCPYLDQIHLIPGNPTDTDQVKLAVVVTASSMGYFVSSNVSFPSQGNIEASFCYFAGMLPSLQTYDDTLNLGVLPAGNYQLVLRAFQTSDPNDCNAGMMNDSILNFSVSTVTALPHDLSPADGSPKRIMAEDLQTLFKAQNGRNVSIFNGTGQLEYSGFYPPSGDFPPGLHFIVFGSNSGIGSRFLWIKP